MTGLLGATDINPYYLTDSVRNPRSVQTNTPRNPFLLYYLAILKIAEIAARSVSDGLLPRFDRIPAIAPPRAYAWGCYWELANWFGRVIPCPTTFGYLFAKSTIL